MEIKQVTVGLYQTNCYIVIEDNHAIIIDPGARKEKIMAMIPEGITVDAILLTHGHLDHIGAVDALMKQYHCVAYASEADFAMLKDPRLNCSNRANITVEHPVLPLTEGEQTIGRFFLEVIFTPGHTAGSLVIRIEDALFTGDTLFTNSVGRTDLPTGNASQLRQSLRTLRQLSPILVVYPGHEETTTIGQELANNPYFQ